MNEAFCVFASHAFLRRNQPLTNPLSTQEKLAIACAGVPLTAGTSIYVLWRLTYWTDLEWAGIWTIQIGTLLFLIGGLLLLSDLWLSKSGQRNWVRKFVIGILLLANFPVSGFFSVPSSKFVNAT